MPNPFMLKTAAEEREWAQEMGYLPLENPKGFSLLTVTSKMVTYSFGIPAYQTCPGSDVSREFKKGICWLCYAAGHNYKYPSVKTAMGMRLKLAFSPDDFVEVFKEALRKPYSHAYTTHAKKSLGLTREEFIKIFDRGGYFRIHDSGDFFSPEYVLAWDKIVAHFPEIQFWAPTRVWGMPSRWKMPRPELKDIPWNSATIEKSDMIEALAKFSRNRNVLLRPSMMVFDQKPSKRSMDLDPRVKWGAPSGAFLFKNHQEIEVDRSYIAIHPDADHRLQDGRVKVLWQAEEVGIERKWKGTFACPAGYVKGVQANCQSSQRPDGKKPCRVCWDDRKRTVAYRQH